VSITIENSPKIMLIDIENSWILTFKKSNLTKQMAIFVSCTHLILGKILWIVKLKFYVTSSSFTKHPYFKRNVILCKFLEQC
jgi:hypothetical protein